MIQICPIGPSIINSPFRRESGVRALEKEGIKISGIQEADVVISGTFKKLLTLMLVYGGRKKYLLWTMEPRFSKHFSSRISLFPLPEVEVMNVYTGDLFFSNYLYAPTQRELPKLENFEFKSGKRIVTLMTKQSGREWQFIHRGIDLDLCNLRTLIALDGFRKGVIDIYGKGWPEEVILGKSRGNGWHEKKTEYIEKLSFQSLLRKH